MRRVGGMHVDCTLLPLQAAAREQLRRQQHELEAMRTRYLQQEGHVSLRKELEEVRGEVER